MQKEMKTTPQYWDCECKKDYIRPSYEDRCLICGALREDQPDSIIDEVKAHGLPLLKTYEVRFFIEYSCNEIDAYSEDEALRQGQEEFDKNNPFFDFSEAHKWEAKEIKD